MLGAVIGDFIGSRFEFHPTKSTDFDLVTDGCIYTDDTVMTIALAEAIADGDTDYAAAMRRRGKEWVTSYGPTFWKWLNRPDMGPYGSWGNGSAMRVSPAAWFARSMEDCLDLAEATSVVSHNHPEGIRGARATAAAIYAARSGWSMQDIRNMLTTVFGYDMTRSVDEIRPMATFELKCWISVPEALTCALEARSFEETVRMAVSLGGDADTQAAIAGAVAEARFGVPKHLAAAILPKLPEELRNGLLRTMKAARGVRFSPADRSDMAAIRAWDPEENEVWRRNDHRGRMLQEEVEAIDKWSAFAESLNAKPAPRSGLWQRIFGSRS